MHASDSSVLFSRIAGNRCKNIVYLPVEIRPVSVALNSQTKPPKLTGISHFLGVLPHPLFLLFFALARQRQKAAFSRAKIRLTSIH
jgi:hypothetical protein